MIFLESAVDMVLKDIDLARAWGSCQSTVMGESTAVMLARWS